MPSTIFEKVTPASSVISHSLEKSVLSPFWQDDAPLGLNLPRLHTSIRCDLAVVGAGFTGLWTALEAKRRHPEWRVVILEGRDPGWAASGRNGGFVQASLTHGEANGRRRFPNEYDILDRAGRENLDAIERIAREENFDCDFWRVGSLAVAVEDHQVQWLKDSADGKRDVFLDVGAVRERVNSPTYLAGLYSPHDTAMVHPSKLTRGLLTACLERGVEVFAHSPVRSIDASSTEVTLGADGGSVSASKIALATNAFPSLLKRFRLHTIPVYDYVLMTEPLSADQRASVGWRGLEGLEDLANQFHYYRITADGRILFGGYDAVYHYGGKIRQQYDDRPESFQRLASHFFTTFPQLEGIRFSHRWSGVIDTCSRFSAFFATAHRNRVAYSAGFTGLGVAATRFAAEVMLDQLEGLSTWRTELSMVRNIPTPFPPEPLCFPVVQLTRSELNRADHRFGKRSLFLKTLDAFGLGFDS